MTLPSREGVRAAYADLEREQFGADEVGRERITELLRLTRAQMADDSITADRARFGGQRTLSLDRFAESGYEPSPEDGPTMAVQEEQEALEEGMRPFLSALPMDERDALANIFRYGFSYRDAARRLAVTTPSLQRRVARAIRNLKAALLEAASPPPVPEAGKDG